jgi:hypothetical protein
MNRHAIKLISNGIHAQREIIIQSGRYRKKKALRVSRLVIYLFIHDDDDDDDYPWGELVKASATIPPFFLIVHFSHKTDLSCFVLI